jgi:hypothetical protein
MEVKRASHSHWPMLDQHLDAGARHVPYFARDARLTGTAYQSVPKRNLVYRLC